MMLSVAAVLCAQALGRAEKDKAAIKKRLDLMDGGSSASAATYATARGTQVRPPRMLAVLSPLWLVWLLDLPSFRQRGSLRHRAWHTGQANRMLNLATSSAAYLLKAHSCFQK